MTTVCAQPGCPNDATHRGRCPDHQQTRRTGTPRSSTRRWRKLRARAMRRARHRCQHPGCTRPATHVHHTRPVGQGGQDLPPLAELRALCTEHHQQRHPHGR